MQFSKNWIGDYVELPAEVEKLGERLTNAGLSVEGLEVCGDDHLMDLDVTTNRPDCMNHFGLAREVAAIFGRELRRPAVELEPVADAIEEVASLEIDDYELCPRYTALALRGVKVGPSPDWLVDRLEAIGSRSINNIVDVTNYVLWETGQPLHAFDLTKIGGGHIRVRRAAEGETLKTLDGDMRSLDPSILVIADGKEPIALAGVMGGFDSEVTDATVDVLIESAHFDPTTVRKGAKKLGLHTDACHRFERGADPEACLDAARRAAALMIELAGGELLAGALDLYRPSAEWPPRIEIDVRRLDRFAGASIGWERTRDILDRLGFDSAPVEGRDDDGQWLEVTAPPWRYYDFENGHAQDVYEEVMRIYGFDAIEATLPNVGGPDAPELPELRRRRIVQDTLAAAGFAETINFAFHSRDVDDAYPTFYADREAMELANALSDLYAIMRRSLLPNLVATARYNQRRGRGAVRVFEVGRIFGADAEQGRVEMETVAIVLGCVLGTPWSGQRSLDFFDLKGVVEALATALSTELRFRSAEALKLVPGATAEILKGEGPVGLIGQLDEPDLAYPLFVVEISLDRLGASTVSLETKAPSRFPGIEVDLTLGHSLDVPWHEIRDEIQKAEVTDLVSFELKDRYDGEGVAAGAVNTTIAFTYNADGRSLRHDEINERQSALAARLEQRFGLGDAR
ncbi:MAG: phenylalanine--tRNA ligase subunit beta [Acidobacteriota bacterium]